jgi:hypothetical protein
MNQSWARIGILITPVLACTIMPASYSLAQNEAGRAEVIYEFYHDTSLALRDIKPGAYHEAAGSGTAQGSAATAGGPAAGLTAVSPLVGTQSVLNFDGISHTGWLSPDTNGAAGATQFVQFVNTQFAVYNKSTGAKVFGPVMGSTVFSGFGGTCETNNGGDIIVQYDKAAARWVLTQRAIQAGSPFLQCVAVSTTSDATGSWNRYAFVLTSNYPDYPKLAVWPDAYYISINQQNPTTFAFVGGLACALDRSKMLTGAAATAHCVKLSMNASSILPSDLDGATAPAAGSPNYFIGLAPKVLNLWKFHVDFAHPVNTTFTGPTTIPIAPYGQACNGGTCIAQPGTTQRLDSLGDRLMYRLAYRNFGTHESLVVTHTVNGSLGNAAIRWYEIRSPGASPAVFQQGTFSPNVTNRWLGSMAMDKVGDIAVGYSVSSATVNPGIRFTGRVTTDPPGLLESEANVVAGTAAQTGSTNWGDYSSMAIDPVDDCTFWYTNEYYKTAGNGTWNTRIFAFKFSACQ